MNNKVLNCVNKYIYFRFAVYTAFVFIIFAPQVFAGKGKKLAGPKHEVSNIIDGVIKIDIQYPVKGLSKKDCDGSDCSVTLNSHYIQGEHLLVYSADRIDVCRLKYQFVTGGGYLNYENKNISYYLDEAKSAQLLIGDINFDEKAYPLVGQVPIPEDIPLCEIEKSSITIAFRPAENRVAKAASNREFHNIGFGYASDITVPVKTGNTITNVVIGLDRSANQNPDSYIADRTQVTRLRYFSATYGNNDYEYFGDVYKKKKK